MGYVEESEASLSDVARPSVPLVYALRNHLQPRTPTAVLDSPVFHPHTLPAMEFRSGHFWRQDTRTSLLQLSYRTWAHEDFVTQRGKVCTLENAIDSGQKLCSLPF